MRSVPVIPLLMVFAVACSSSTALPECVDVAGCTFELESVEIDGAELADPWVGMTFGASRVDMWVWLATGRPFPGGWAVDSVIVGAGEGTLHVRVPWSRSGDEVMLEGGPELLRGPWTLDGRRLELNSDTVRIVVTR
jgi:hypothetical protein